MKTLSLLTCVSLLVPQAPPESPQAQVQEPKTLTLIERDGETVSAQVLGLRGDEAHLRVFILGGSMEVRRKLGDFAPASAFQIELEAKKPAGYEAHFELAKKAWELDLVPQAGSQARAAIDAVADSAKAEQCRTEVRAWAADAMEKKLVAALAAKKLNDANHYLKLLSTRFADQRSEEQLDAHGAAVQALEEQIQEQRQQERQARLDAQRRADIERRLQPIKKQIAAGDKKHREAVRRSRSTVASSNLCEAAIADYTSAWKALEQLVARFPDDAELAREAASLGQHLHEHAIRAGLHAANMLTVQSDFKNAMSWANKVLAYDPGNAEAKDMIRTIQLAQAMAGAQWGWGWRTAGWPGPDPRNR